MPFIRKPEGEENTLPIGYVMAPSIPLQRSGRILTDTCPSQGSHIGPGCLLPLNNKREMSAHVLNQDVEPV